MQKCVSAFLRVDSKKDCFHFLRTPFFYARKAEKMTQDIKIAEESVRLLTLYANSHRLSTALFANHTELYGRAKIQRFLVSHDCLFPCAQKHPRTYLDAENVYRKIADAHSLKSVQPMRYETVYCEFGKIEKSTFGNLSLTLPYFEDENNYIVYSPANDTYQYGFYHYGRLREGAPMEICPSGRLLIRLEAQKEKRPRLLLAGDAFAPFLVSYMAHHYDICLHAPIGSARLLAYDLSRFQPDVFMLLGGIALLADPLLSHALQAETKEEK